MTVPFVDSHAHLFATELRDDVLRVLDRARMAGLVAIVVVGIDAETNDEAIALASRHSDVWATVGIHPNRADSASEGVLRRLEDQSHAPKVVAIGECGLDFYRDRVAPEVQRRAFGAQLDLARRRQLPVVIHSREAMTEALDTLAAAALPKPGVMHCFDGTVADAQRAVSIGLAISLAGPITYRRDQTLAQAVAAVPVDRIMIETDCPYLPTKLHRGRPSEPAHVVAIAESIARARSESLGDVARLTTDTALRTFGIEAATVA